MELQIIQNKILLKHSFIYDNLDSVDELAEVFEQKFNSLVNSTVNLAGS